MRDSTPRSPRRRQTLQRLSALTAASLLPLSADRAFAATATASALNVLPRTALVVGNGRYREAPLNNPVNDAGALADRLKKLGFAVVAQFDADKAAMENAIRAYAEGLARSKGVGLFYFAGHGLQVNWRNFLVPADARIERADDIARQAVDLAALLGGIGKASNPMNIVILDACRDNPFGGDLRSGKGLSQMDAPIGSLLAYATAPGNVASDGTGANGLYTENLLREIGTPEAKIEDVFKRVRLAVRRASSGRQIPWESTSLEEDFYFLPPASIKKLSEEELARQFAEEAAAWEKAQQATQLAVVEDYIQRYPSGRFSELAQVRLDRMLAKRGEKKVSVVNAAANPFTKGTGVIDLDYRIGDRYIYSSTDLLTKIEARRLVQNVTEVGEDRIVFNHGAMITDYFGNFIRRPDGATFGPTQVFIGEYSIGKKWATRFAINLPNGHKDTIELDLKVIGRESTSVSAGTFDCFVVECKGWMLNVGQEIEYRFWIAPEQVNRFIVLDAWWRRGNRIMRSERQELVSFTRAG